MSLASPLFFIPVGERPVEIQWKVLFIWAVTFLFMVVLEALVKRTRVGMAMRACSLDQETAALMGIDVNRIIALTFAIGSAMAAAAGILFGLYRGASIGFRMGYQPGFLAFSAAVLGGIGNIRGAILGGFILGAVETMSRGLYRRLDWDQRSIRARFRLRNTDLGHPNSPHRASRLHRRGKSVIAMLTKKLLAFLGDSSRRPLRLMGLLGALTAVLAPLITMLPGQPGRNFAAIVLLCILYAIVALGLNVVTGFTGLLDIGVVVFASIGAYTACILYDRQWMQFPFSFVVVLLVGGLHAAAWGLARRGADAPALRRLLRHRHPGVCRNHAHRAAKRSVAHRRRKRVQRVSFRQPVGSQTDRRRV